jgi:hypothetical protein
MKMEPWIPVRRLYWTYLLVKGLSLVLPSAEKSASISNWKDPYPPSRHPLPPPSRSIAENTKNHRVNSHGAVRWTSRGRDSKAHSLRLAPLVCHLFCFLNSKGAKLLLIEKCLLFYDMFILWWKPFDPHHTRLASKIASCWSRSPLLHFLGGQPHEISYFMYGFTLTNYTDPAYLSGPSWENTFLYRTG